MKEVTIISVNGAKIEVPSGKYVSINGHIVNSKFVEMEQLVCKNLHQVIEDISILRQRFEHIEELQEIDAPLHEILNILEE